MSRTPTRALATLTACALALLHGAAAMAYPGGTPTFQTDVAPFCASCHSSMTEAALAGAGERAQKEVATKKHLAVVLSGQKGYADLGEEDRKTLAGYIRALDEASTVTLEAPAKVKRDEVFEVRVKVTGGAGPVVGVGLVDRDHRWYAKPATSAGWTVALAPKVSSEGVEAQGWVERRPEAIDRKLTYVNVPDIESDPANGDYAEAEVVFTLRAPNRGGSLPLAAVFFYGTEKSTVLGYKTNAVGWKGVRGGTGGGSGRVVFTPVKTIEVE